MRLGGWIVLELAVGGSLLAGLSTGVYFGAAKLRDLSAGWSSNEAYAAQETPPPMAASLAPFHPVTRTLPPREIREQTHFLGIADDVLTAPLLTNKVTRVKFNHGGSSISLRLDFEGGSRAAFKPDQTNEQTVPRKEIAAYRINRLMGLESVAPAVPRRFLPSELIDDFDAATQSILPRFNAEIILDSDGMVVGELAWWIPTIVDATMEGTAIDTPEGMKAWHQYLTVGEPEPYAARTMLPQISNMVAFDYLINNSDRWSGSNAKASPDMKILYFMDNTLSFGPVPEGVARVRLMLEHVQKFSRSLVGKVRALDEKKLRTAMTTDTGPYEQLLTDAEIAAVLYRRDLLIAYFDDLIAQYGEAAVLVYQ